MNQGPWRPGDAPRRDGRLVAPAAARNREAIADVLRRELPDAGMVLEVASGSGEHAVHFAAHFPHLDWQPSDSDPVALESISAWREEAGTSNLRPPVELDASRPPWQVDGADAILCVNMVHISPWEAACGLFAGAAALLMSRHAPLILYGPYVEADVDTAPGNMDFDRQLRARNPLWGLRDVADMDAQAVRHGFARTARYAMPANNLTLVYRLS